MENTSMGVKIFLVNFHFLRFTLPLFLQLLSLTHSVLPFFNTYLLVRNTNIDYLKICLFLGLYFLIGPDQGNMP